MPADSPSFRVSGHETFACRYTWLPKAVRYVSEDASILNREDDAMVTFGVGKNMVRSIRFWAEAARIIARSEQGHVVTEFGRQLLQSAGREQGFDPFLEDIQTLWLIHWNLASNATEPLYGWDFLLNRWQHPHLTASMVISAFVKDRSLQERPPSEKTLEQMYEVFIHTYLPSRGRKGEVREDNLDSPLVELQLLVPEGLRQTEDDARRHEPVFRFRREAKPEISMALFAYCLDDFWRTRHPDESSVPLNLVVSGHGSPGQLFKLPEEDIRNRVEQLAEETDGTFRFEDSSAQPAVVRDTRTKRSIPLAAVYQHARAL